MGGRLDRSSIQGDKGQSTRAPCRQNLHEDCCQNRLPVHWFSSWTSRNPSGGACCDCFALFTWRLNPFARLPVSSTLLLTIAHVVFSWRHGCRESTASNSNRHSRIERRRSFSLQVMATCRPARRR